MSVGGLLTACTTASSDRPGALRIGIGSQPQTLDADKLIAGTDTYFTYNVYETLLGYDVDGEQVPRVAAAMPEVSADGKVFTFKLREGVKFHDGTPVTAEDVQFSYERYVDPKTGNGFAFYLEDFDRVEILAPDRVAVHLKKYTAGFLPGGGFAAIVPKKYIEKHGNDYFGSHPIGTGPLKFVSRALNSNFVLQRFEGYWGAKPGYREFVFQIIPNDATRVAALRSGQVDVIAQLPPKDIAQLRSTPGLSVKTTLDGDSVDIKFNLRKGQAGQPWADPRVREAMDYAIDRETLIDKVLFHQAQIDTALQPTNRSWAQAQRAGLRPRPYDPDKARALLDAAGYGDGFSFDFAGLADGRLPVSAEITQAVAGYWSAIGLKPNVEILSYDTWISAIKSTSTYPVMFNLWGDQLNGPSSRLLGDYSSKGLYSNVADPELDRRLSEAVSTVDTHELDEKYVDVAEYLQDHTYSIPLCALRGAFAMKESVDWQPWSGVPATIMHNARPA